MHPLQHYTHGCTWSLCPCLTNAPDDAQAFLNTLPTSYSCCLHRNCLTQRAACVFTPFDYLRVSTLFPINIRRGVVSQLRMRTLNKVVPKKNSPAPVSQAMAWRKILP